MQRCSTIPLLLQSTTDRHLPRLLPRLKMNLRSAGAWISDVQTGEARGLSQRSADVYLELPASAAQSIYTALVRCGLDLSRSAHIALATLCSRDRVSKGVTHDLKLEIRFMAVGPYQPKRISAICA